MAFWKSKTHFYVTKWTSLYMSNIELHVIFNYPSEVPPSPYPKTSEKTLPLLKPNSKTSKKCKFLTMVADICTCIMCIICIYG